MTEALFMIAGIVVGIGVGVVLTQEMDAVTRIKRMLDECRYGSAHPLPPAQNPPE